MARRTSKRSEPLATPLFAPAPSVMIVELEEPVRSWCDEAAPGMTLLVVGHVLAARERAPVTRPLVIVIPDTDRDAVDLAEVAQATGAELLRFLPTSGREFFQTRLREAIRVAEQRRGKRS